VPSVSKKGGVRPFRNFDDYRFAAAFPIKILVELQPQLANVNANRTVLDDAVILGFSENGASDAMLAQVLCLAMQSSLSKETQQISESRRLLEGWAGDDSFDQLPAGVCPKSLINFRHSPSIPIHIA
jgi:hypothetical protein